MPNLPGDAPVQFAMRDPLYMCISGPLPPNARSAQMPHVAYVRMRERGPSHTAHVGLLDAFVPSDVCELSCTAVPFRVRRVRRRAREGRGECAISLAVSVADRRDRIGGVLSL